MSQKNPVTPPGIDPGTVRIVAQCLNYYATPGPNNRINIHLSIIKAAYHMLDFRLPPRVNEILTLLGCYATQIGT